MAAESPLLQTHRHKARLLGGGSELCMAGVLFLSWPFIAVNVEPLRNLKEMSVQCCRVKCQVSLVEVWGVGVSFRGGPHWMRDVVFTLM